MAPRELAASDGDPLTWRERLRGYSALVGGDRAPGWLVVLLPVGWALWLAAKGWPSPGLLLALVAGGILLRAASRAVDGYFGAVQDALAGRIARFPADAELVDPRLAALLCLVLLLVVASLVLALDPAAQWLGASWTVLALGYILVKRHLYLAQAYVGVLAAWGVPMAFAARLGTVPALGWTLYVAAVFWASACATWRAMAERDDDLLTGAKSLAILLGEVDLIGQGVLYAGAFIALALVGREAGMGVWYWAGLALALVPTALAFRAARQRDPDGCLRALGYNGWIGLAVLAGIVLDFALRAKLVAA
ncbi:UbiA family prenyltransferase [Thermomonas sp.]|uniref:UbiA family prenyltransferase n=1 Tax=Thermomonas sp. TaxID=1971895 RepID=UPI002637DA1E|nr:UbiA family prenyltransferase [Thermomonas sp.]MCO5055425.1 UbiA family prenyltransferase [Thermomonas sp.]